MVRFLLGLRRRLERPFYAKDGYLGELTGNVRGRGERLCHFWDAINGVELVDEDFLFPLLYLVLHKLLELSRHQGVH